MNKIKDLRDGLTLEKLQKKYPWVLEADISDAVIGQDGGVFFWYGGTWHTGIWEGGEE